VENRFSDFGPPLFRLRTLGLNFASRHPFPELKKVRTPRWSIAWRVGGRTLFGDRATLSIASGWVIIETQKMASIDLHYLFPPALLCTSIEDPVMTHLAGENGRKRKNDSKK
jgi:hypothetical protein